VALGLAAFMAAGAAGAEGFSLFAGVQPSASYSDHRGFHAESGWALGLELPLAARWSAQALLSLEDFGGGISDRGAFVDGGDSRTGDVTVFYRFAEAGDWAFRVGAGLRHGSLDLGDENDELWATTAAFTADWRFAQRLALRLDGRQLLTALSGDSRRFGEQTFTLGVLASF
jgi:hypothetical protein